MEYKKTIEHITNWMNNQLEISGLHGFVIGVSGGVDSALTSTLCALTNSPTICLSMPINQKILPRAEKHINWLKAKYSNVSDYTINLSNCFNNFDKSFDYTELALANLRSRLRMAALYAVSNSKNYMVVGTGNKVEDFGIMFFTLGGDGQVDISPIGDLLKSQVKKISKFLDINLEIIQADPSDNLWDDNRIDEDAIGATYEELEWAMNYCNDNNIEIKKQLPIWESKDYIEQKISKLQNRKKQVLKIYLERHIKGLHKIFPIPVCKIPQNLI